MTAAMTDFDPPVGGWTTDELDELPQDGRRREIIDGVLIVSPSPTNIHQIIAGRLMTALEDTCPPECSVTLGVEVRVTTRRSFIPDVLVCTAEAAERSPAKLAPHEVVLAVEIVSPSSVTLDRVTKPALYAHAEIPYYWRVETGDGIVAYTQRLDSAAGVYVLTGRHDTVIDTAEPWEISIPIKRLTPRFYR